MPLPKQHHVRQIQDRYRIPSARWQDWIMGGTAPITLPFATAGRECCFGKIENAKMVLSNLGIIADIFWHE